MGKTGILNCHYENLTKADHLRQTFPPLLHGGQASQNSTVEAVWP